MPEAVLIPPIFDRQRIQRLARRCSSSALLVGGRGGGAAPSLADARVRGDRFGRLDIGQATCGQVGGVQELVDVAVRPAVDEPGRPSPVRKAGIELLLGLVTWQGVERGYAADDETLTFQLDG